ncbi:MAG: cellulase family glycosylhydrolase [Actinomycetales bacterium]|nr:cellulase family glycosylhydrolase [Actinomycetales bacterium]
MRRLTAIASLTAVGALLSSLVVVPAAEARPRQDLRGTTVQQNLFGMHVFNVQNGQWPTVPIGSLRLWDNETTWAQVEPAPGQFDWTKLDAAVQNAQSHGVNDILMVLAGTPAWATDNPASGGAAGVLPGAAGMPKNIADWDAWVTAVATRYKGRITSYQPWNEANLVTFSTGTPQQMAELTKHAYDIIKSIDPNATVVAPSMGTRLGSNGSQLSKKFMQFYGAYLRQLKADNWPVDVWSAHTYPASLGTPADRALLIKGFQNALRAFGAPDKPIWDTENNFGLAGPGPQNPDQDITDYRAASWTARTYLDALRYGISRVYWYAWGPENDLVGIQMYDGSPGAQAYATLQDWIVGATFKKCTGTAKVTCTFIKDGKRTKIVYAAKNRKNFVTKGFSQVCELDGTCTPITGKRIRTAGPVLLKK